MLSAKGDNRSHLLMFCFCRLTAGHVMSDDVIFVKPVEKVGVVYDILKLTTHSNFPVVDMEDDGVLAGTIGRNALCILLKQRAYGKPVSLANSESIISNYLTVNEGDKEERFLPLIQWEVIEKAYPKYPSIAEIRISAACRECFVDLRPYMNTAPIAVREAASISVRYQCCFLATALNFYNLFWV